MDQALRVRVGRVTSRAHAPVSVRWVRVGRVRTVSWLPPRGDGSSIRDAIVLGAGISGLVSASVLLGQGAQEIVILDEYDHVGGNHIDRSIGDYTFDIGSLIFQDDSPL